MSDLNLTPSAAALLDTLRYSLCLEVSDAVSAEELVAKGLAAHVPATGTIEITEAGRARPAASQLGGEDTPSPRADDRTAPNIPHMDRRDRDPKGLRRSGQGSDGLSFSNLRS